MQLACRMPAWICQSTFDGLTSDLVSTDFIADQEFSYHWGKKKKKHTPFLARVDSFLKQIKFLPLYFFCQTEYLQKIFSHKMCLIEWYFLFKNANYSFGQLWSAYSACSIYLKLSQSKNYLKLLDVLTQLSSPMNNLNPYLKTLISGLAALKLLLLPWLFHLTLN